MRRCQAGFIQAVPLVSNAQTEPSGPTASCLIAAGAVLSIDHVCPASPLRHAAPVDVTHQRSFARPTGAWAKFTPACCHVPLRYW